MDPSGGSSSSAPVLQPFWSGTSYVKWYFAKAVWYVDIHLILNVKKGSGVTHAFNNCAGSLL